jgi:D-2-hydroxyacid dehydrogenase (NADP+)
MDGRLLIIDRRADALRARLAQEFPSLDIITAQAPADAISRLDRVVAIIGFGYSFADELFRKAGALEWLQFLSSGTDRLVNFPSLPDKVVVTSCQGIHGPPVSEMAFFHMLALSRDVYGLVKNREQGLWEQADQKLLYRKTVVVLGTGTIARDFAARCKVFGMTVIGVSAMPRRIDGFDEVVGREALKDTARRADFLVVLTSYSKETHALVDAEVLGEMKPTAIILNLSRGAICDEEALLEALTSGRIGGAGLDVFNAEPLPDDHPFWGLDNVFITPHIAGSNDSFPDLMMPVLTANIRRFFDGQRSEMMNQVRR